MSEQLTLFGPAEALKPINKTKSRHETFNDYEGFVSKFDAPKTTDDCFTPEPVYRAVVEFVRTLVPLDGRPIVRPFFPGGDYENHEYPENCIVIDNPPFSILSKILRFYSLRGVPFFLFGPSLTLLTAPDCDLTYIIADTDIIYANGAKVRTGFITNVIPDVRIWCCPTLKESIEKAQAVPNKTKKGFIYPDNIVTAATLQRLTAHGVDFRVPKAACRYINNSDGAKRHGRGLFGGGYLLSERAAAERAAAERAAAERAAATVLELSPREKLIVEELNKCY